MTLGLRDVALLRDRCLVGGTWTPALAGRTFDVCNPADGSLIARVPDMGVGDARRAIAAAEGALPAWRSRTAKSRATVIRAWYDLIVANTDDLSRLITAEQGKPLSEARGEIAYGASFVEWFAEESKRIYGDTLPSHGVDKRLVVIKQPIGVTAAITPWNFPIAMVTRKVAPALAAGCTVVVKPAEETPLSALALAYLAEQAGFPPGVLNVITGEPAEIGGEFSASTIVRKLSFTGSTEVGKLLMGQCANTIKKLSLELGGNAPFIVFDDADLELAVAGAIASKYRNSGQTCVCANRFFVQDSIYDAFAERLVQAVETLKVGPGLLDREAQQGPLINVQAFSKVERLVEDALVKGAQALTGAKQHSLGGTFYQPTVLINATPEMKICHEEIFGPVAALCRFSSESDVIRAANDTRHGLAAYFYTRDFGRVWRMAEALEAGMVGINEGLISTELAPFGGIKESGIGREGSKYGIDEFLEVKYLCMGGLQN
ncbi:MAG: NAD-dependent succinate-semialdehyde dehydrogenase [Mesorhizobium sp.]|nr:MAG: NAD-dependent succinate-semialdehyde dehydrogenase [Mesorhizobium sp.]